MDRNAWALKARIALVTSIHKLKKLKTKPRLLYDKIAATPRLRRGLVKIGAIILGLSIIGGGTYYYLENSPIYLLADGEQIALAAGKTRRRKLLCLRKRN